MPDINEGNAWTQADGDDLRHEVSNGWTADHAATFLCWSSDEVMKRAAQLGLRWGEHKGAIKIALGGA